jgi:hypothetical protein
VTSAVEERILARAWMVYLVVRPNNISRIRQASRFVINSISGVCKLMSYTASFIGVVGSDSRRVK